MGETRETPQGLPGGSAERKAQSAEGLNPRPSARCPLFSARLQGVTGRWTIRFTISSMTTVPRRTFASDMRSLFPCSPLS